MCVIHDVLNWKVLTRHRYLHFFFLSTLSNPASRLHDRSLFCFRSCDFRKVVSLCVTSFAHLWRVCFCSSLPGFASSWDIHRRSATVVIVRHCHHWCINHHKHSYSKTLPIFPVSNAQQIRSWFEEWLNVGQSWPTLLISNQTIVPGLCLPLLPAWQMPSPQQVAWEKFARIHPCPMWSSSDARTTSQDIPGPRSSTARC